MSPIFLTVSIGLVIAQLAIPKKYAFLPILIAAYNLGNVEFFGQFTTIRLIILVGILRALFSGQSIISWKNPIDRLIILFGFFVMLAAPFHKEATYNPYTYNLGLFYNIAGSYFYGKSFLKGPNLIRRFAFAFLISLLPLAIFSILEASSGKNFYYSHFGARSASAIIREGFRARGPFGHPILLGTAGAAAICLFVPFFKTSRKFAYIGILGSVLITVASNSSGPIAAALFASGVVYFWRWRNMLVHTKWVAPAIIIFLSIYMERPIYYIIDSIDFTGGSTGWFRARLIESSLQNFSDWWLFGTDYTRHWMATGVSWNPNHTDMVNYYLHLGVTGGVVLPVILIAIIWISVKKLLRAVKYFDNKSEPHKAFTVWCLIAVLTTHASSFVSVSYFDQMYVLFYLLIALIANFSFETLTNASEPSSKTTN
ncbi:MAG: hypothetical protein CBC35_01430 [Planctomycetes bacterium TMED75]|nr:MAG: hypothetical protein CBC35_01430 [Planctomycetes bacterium TMED75]